MEEVSSNVETIEVEAEKILESARGRANEILHKAREEARKISSSELPMDEVKKECESIIHEAAETANKKIEASLLESSEVRARADEKVGEIVKRIVNIVTGVKPR
jgi:vacuolar-type H+-ATPase subunit H